MSDNTPIFMPGDCVYYTGSKFKSELVSKDGKPHKGWIHAPVLNQPGVYVVEFPELKEGDFILAAVHLSKARPAKTDKYEGGPEIQPRRSRKGEEDAAKS